MAAESLDSLKRWREERWDLRADRARLRALAEADARAGARTAASAIDASQLNMAATSRRRGRRPPISRWIRPWPTATLGDLLRGSWNESSLGSPVHPEWDDPGARRLTRSLFGSVAANLIFVPLFLYVMDFRLPEPSSQVSLKPYTVSFSAPRGNSPTAPRALKPPAMAAPARASVSPPKPEPPRPEPSKPEAGARPAPTQTTSPEKDAARTLADDVRSPTARAKANDGNRVRETADPTLSRPVPAREKGNTKAGDGVTRKSAPATAPDATAAKDVRRPAEPAVTEPVARPGPLVASVAGPVAGSELSLGDLDGVSFPHSYYLEQIRDKIAQHWGPPEGMARGRQLKAVVTFRILRSGRIGEQVLEEPSGHAIFDQAALRAVTDAQKFGPLPEAFPGAFLVVHFNFTYTSP